MSIQPNYVKVPALNFNATSKVWNTETSNNMAIKVAQKIMIAVATAFVAIAETLVNMIIILPIYMAANTINTIHNQFAKKTIVDLNEKKLEIAEQVVVAPVDAPVDAPVVAPVVAPKSRMVSIKDAGKTLGNTLVHMGKTAQTIPMFKAMVNGTVVAGKAIFNKTVAAGSTAKTFIGNHKKDIAVCTAIAVGGFSSLAYLATTPAVSAAFSGVSAALANNAFYNMTYFAV